MVQHVVIPKNGAIGLPICRRTAAGFWALEAADGLEPARVPTQQLFRHLVAALRMHHHLRAPGRPWEESGLTTPDFKGLPALPG
jgi:hypothetical protein